jgi:hypothetical protein
VEQTVVAGRTPTPYVTWTPVVQAATIRGRLLWNELPAAGVEVRLTTELAQPYLTLTDSGGIYSFQAPAGEYLLAYRFPGQIRWTSANTTPHFSPYQYVELPLSVDGVMDLSLNDIHTIKAEDLTITDPPMGEAGSSTPTFVWEAYPSADYYMIWIYESIEYQGVPALIPLDILGNPGTTRQTSFQFDVALPASEDYYTLWILAYNVEDHELADAHGAFSVK